MSDFLFCRLSHISSNQQIEFTSVTPDFQLMLFVRKLIRAVRQREMNNLNIQKIIGRIIAIACLSLGTSCHHQESGANSFLPNLPPANPKAYSSVRVGEDWENPYLVIHPNGVQILHANKLVEPNDLKAALASLPNIAWPYGRVVAVSEIGIRSGNNDQMIEEVLNQVLSILHTLDITVSMWPSS
jgi:hypothetical protein